MQRVSAGVLAASLLGYSSSADSGSDIIVLFERTSQTSACRETFDTISALFEEKKELQLPLAPGIFQEEQSKTDSCRIVFFPGDKPDYTCLLPPSSWLESEPINERRYGVQDN